MTNSELREHAISWFEQDKDNRSVILISMDDSETADKYQKWSVLFAGKTSNIGASLGTVIKTNGAFRSILLRAINAAQEVEYDAEKKDRTDNKE